MISEILIKPVDDGCNDARSTVLLVAQNKRMVNNNSTNILKSDETALVFLEECCARWGLHHKIKIKPRKTL